MHHIEEYLNYYVSLDKSPRFAVLISGSWGSGKTWFVKDFIEKGATNNSRFLYVSLYGLSKTAEIDDQFFQQLHPVLASKPFSISTKLIKAFGKGALRLDFDGDGKKDGSVNVEIPNFEMPKFLSDVDSRVLVFDDFERSKIPLEDLMGYINYFVEHLGHKVILLADEEKIVNSEVYFSRKEKIIGRTFHYLSNAEMVLVALLEDLSDPDVLKALRNNLHLVIASSAIEGRVNYRTLRKGLLEFERYFKFVESKFLSNDELVANIVRSFFCIFAEIDRGDLRHEDLEEMAKSFYFYSSSNRREELVEGKRRAIDRIERHFQGSQSNVVPSMELILRYFKFGVLGVDEFEKSLLSSKYYYFENLPYWEKLWYFSTLSDDEFDICLKGVKKEFFGKESLEEGVLKHISGMLLYFEHVGICAEGYEEVFNKIVSCIERRVRRKQVEYPSTDLGARGFRFDDAFASKVFMMKDSEEFRRISNILNNGFEEERHSRLSEVADNVLDIMINRTSEFFYTIQGSLEGIYLGSVPILKFIDAGRFVSEYLKLSKNSHDIPYSINERYKANFRLLQDEMEWLKAVLNHLDNALKKGKKKRLVRYRAHELKKVVEQKILLSSAES